MNFLKILACCVLLSVVTACNVRKDFEIQGPIQVEKSSEGLELYSDSFDRAVLVNSELLNSEAKVFVDRARKLLVFQTNRRFRQDIFLFELTEFLANPANRDALSSGNVLLPAHMSKQLLDLRFKISEELVSQTTREELMKCEASEAGSGVSIPGQQRTLVEKRLVRMRKLLELFKPDTTERALSVQQFGAPEIRLKILKTLGPCNPTMGASEESERPLSPPL